ncbi:hypothetical protein [Pedobacter jamesrossensis]|uniref:Uncharacterized protein n=1 Tax=Pedobacter jamesrossensis TaxID=1908238 RepID=A0ABV8NJL1_9SPHI
MMKRKNRNERQNLEKIAQALRLLQSLEEMELSKSDAFEVQLTKGLLMGTIELSGYRAKYHWLFGLRLLKAPTPQPINNHLKIRT